MALAASAEFTVAQSNPSAGTVATISLSSEWLTAISAGGVTSADASRITDPAAEIIAATRRILLRKGRFGTNVQLSLKYDDGISAVTPPKLAVFGRTNGQRWERLVNKLGQDSVTLVPDLTNDASNGTYNWTIADDSATFDCRGCDEILVGVETALAATGTVSDAIVEAKIY